MDRFTIGVGGDLLRPDGSFAFPAYSLSPLADDPRVELRRIPVGAELRGEDLAGLDAFVSMPMGAAVTARSFPADRRLAAMVRLGVGYEDVDLAACTEHEVALVIPAEVVRRPTAVAALTLLLALATRLIEKHALTLAGPAAWDGRAQLQGTEPAGRTLGVIGLGNIGAELVRLCRPLDLVPIAFDPHLPPARAAALGVRLVDLATLLREADFVSIHCPLSPATRGLLGAAELALMKPTAFLVNTARGGIVDQRALAAALREGRLAGAGLDVFEREPPAPDDPILAAPNVVLSAHALNWTADLDAAFARANQQALGELMAGRVPPGIANPEVLERPGWRAKLAACGARFGADMVALRRLS